MAPRERDGRMKYLQLIRAALVLGFAATSWVAAAADRLTVYAVNYPLTYFAERIAGDAADIVFPVPEDRDPAFWKPSIATISEIQKADLIILNGATFAKWTTKTSLPRRSVVDVSSGFADQFIPTKTITHSHGAEGMHSHTGVASYVWLDVSLAARQAEAIAERLKRLRPDEASRFDERMAALRDDLSGLDAEFAAFGEAFGARPLVASHPRYQYFARRYGLNIQAVEWEPSERPTPEQWAALDAILAEHPATTMIWEATPLDEVAASLRDRGIKSIVVETMANRPRDGDFLETLRRNLEALRTSL